MGSFILDSLNFKALFFTGVFNILVLFFGRKQQIPLKFRSLDNVCYIAYLIMLILAFYSRRRPRSRFLLIKPLFIIVHAQSSCKLKLGFCLVYLFIIQFHVTKKGNAGLYFAHKRFIIPDRTQTPTSKLINV